MRGLRKKVFDGDHYVYKDVYDRYKSHPPRLREKVWIGDRYMYKNAYEAYQKKI